MTDLAYHQAYIRLRSKTTGEWFVHRELRRKLVEDAERQEKSLAEVVTRILAERFGTPYEPAGRRSNPSREDKDILNLRIPRLVWMPVEIMAAQTGRSAEDLARELLCKHYGLTPSSPTPA